MVCRLQLAVQTKHAFRSHLKATQRRQTLALVHVVRPLTRQQVGRRMVEVEAVGATKALVHSVRKVVVVGAERREVPDSKLVYVSLHARI